MSCEGSILKRSASKLRIQKTILARVGSPGEMDRVSGKNIFLGVDCEENGVTHEFILN
jgi:hypothetical protein